ncbi:MAG: hypothetical protein WBG02_06650 [Candidatus Acidiferrum sp.]
MHHAISNFRVGYLAILFLSFGLLRATTAHQNADADVVYIGILDDAREELRNWKAGVAEDRIIMPAFERNDRGWTAIKSFPPKQVKWTIAFDGRKLGLVESQRDTEADQLTSEYSRAKQRILTPAPEIPSIGKPSVKFAGVFAPGPGKFRRPLVAVSKPYFRDPDNWKRGTLPAEIARLVRAGFRRQFPHVDRCSEEQIAERDWKFPDSAIRLGTAYISNKDSFLVATHLDAGDCGWGGHPDDPLDTFVDQWFFVSPDRAVLRIGGFDQLLDAGDYDNDGHSELIFFSMRSEISDAYDLVYGDFQHKVELIIGYN